MSEDSEEDSPVCNCGLSVTVSDLFAERERLADENSDLKEAIVQLAMENLELKNALVEAMGS